MSQNHTLRKGDQSADGWVEYLQQLIERRYPDNERVARMTPGVFDDVLEDIVKTFQHTNGLEDSGVVGDETWSVLRDEAFVAEPGGDGMGRDYVERGFELRFVDGAYEGSGHKIGVRAASVGDKHPDAGTIEAVAFLRHPDGTSPGIVVDHSGGGGPDQWFYTREPIPTDLPGGVYGFLIQLPSETGADTFQFDFNYTPE